MVGDILPEFFYVDQSVFVLRGVQLSFTLPEIHPLLVRSTTSGCRVHCMAKGWCTVKGSL